MNIYALIQELKSELHSYNEIATVYSDKLFPGELELCERTLEKYLMRYRSIAQNLNRDFALELSLKVSSLSEIIEDLDNIKDAIVKSYNTGSRILKYEREYSVKGILDDHISSMRIKGPMSPRNLHSKLILR